MAQDNGSKLDHQLTPNRVAQRARQHFGHGQLRVDFSTSVFINCPFDADFADLFDAIVFVVACCGFLPRSAMESGTVADSRMERIARAIFSSKYSIHDLSRCKGEGSEQLARFNMPLELGIAMARRYAQSRDALKHDWLVLVPVGHNYAKFVSDLAGFDPQQYDGTVPNLVRQVMTWLATRPDAVKAPTPKDVLDALPAFMSKKRELIAQWGRPGALGRHCSRCPLGRAGVRSPWIPSGTSASLESESVHNEQMEIEGQPRNYETKPNYSANAGLFRKRGG